MTERSVVCHVTDIRGPRHSFYPSRGSIDSSTFPLVHSKRAFELDNLLCLFVGEVADMAWRLSRFYTLKDDIVAKTRCLLTSVETRSLRKRVSSQYSGYKHWLYLNREKVAGIVGRSGVRTPVGTRYFSPKRPDRL